MSVCLSCHGNKKTGEFSGVKKWRHNEKRLINEKVQTGRGEESENIEDCRNSRTAGEGDECEGEEKMRRGSENLEEYSGGGTDGEG